MREKERKEVKPAGRKRCNLLFPEQRNAWQTIAFLKQSVNRGNQILRHRSAPAGVLIQTVSGFQILMLFPLGLRCAFPA